MEHSAKKKKNKKKIKTASNSNKASSSKKKLTKSLKAAVVEKWQLTNLAKYNADDWSVVDVDKTTNLVQSMNCSVWTKFLHGKSSVKGFQ